MMPLVLRVAFMAFLVIAVLAYGWAIYEWGNEVDRNAGRTKGNWFRRHE